MKITVKIGDIEITIDRQNFGDDGTANDTNQPRRQNIMKDTVIPTLELVIEKAKYLHELRKQTTI